jgi:hypothetical protein
MQVHIETVQINLTTEHLVVAGFILWATLPKLRSLLMKKK